MPFSSCAEYGETRDDDAYTYPRYSDQSRPKYAGAVALLCNCASLALILALYTSKADVSPPALGTAQAAAKPPQPAPAAGAWRLPCGDDRDCLADAEFAYAPARSLGC